MKATITKIFAVMLAAAICASFAACSKSSEPAEDPDSGSESISESRPVNSGDNEEGEQGDESGADSESGEDAAEPEESTTGSEEGTQPEENAPDNNSDGEDVDFPERDGDTETSVIIPDIPPIYDEEQETASGTGKAIADTAMSAVGYDFLFGGDSPEDGGFDNSGLIYYAMTKNGVSCPRALGEIMNIGSEVSFEGLSAGDAVFFRADEEGSAFFGGVYVGDGKAVMSFSEDIPVKLVDITANYYRSNFVKGVRAAE